MRRLNVTHFTSFVKSAGEKLNGYRIQHRSLGILFPAKTSHISIKDKCNHLWRKFSSDGSQQIKLTRLQEIIGIINRKIDNNNIAQRLVQLEEAIKQPELWKDPKAGKLFKEQSELSKLVSQLQTLKSSRQQYLQLIEFGKEDKEYLNEAESVLNKAYEEALELELGALLSNEGDSGGCFIEVQAGAGGKDSMDWAALLLNMYYQWGNRRGFQVENVDETFGEVGIRSGCIKVDGIFIFFR